MKKCVEDVAAFHLATDVPIRPFPSFPSKDRIDLRRRLIDEERREFDDAIAANDIVDVADALTDLVYVIVGSALEFGINLGPTWDEVQKTNMAKADPATGKIKRRGDGKILKPDGWVPPDLGTIIENQAPLYFDPERKGVCQLCGKPMPEGEEMFVYHGFSGPCPS